MPRFTITSATRIASHPSIPNIAEQGLPNLVGGAWFGILGPRDMPPAIVSTLHREIVEALAAPEMKVGSTPKEFTDFVRRETERWTRIAMENNIRSE